jgi:hypothetical protein
MIRLILAFLVAAPPEVVAAISRMVVNARFIVWKSSLSENRMRPPVISSI